MAKTRPKSSKAFEKPSMQKAAPNAIGTQSQSLGSGKAALIPAIFKGQDLLQGATPKVKFLSPFKDKTWGWRPRWEILQDDGSYKLVVGRQETSLDRAMAKTFFKFEAWIKDGEIPSERT